jgi:hypothetical protein
MSLKDTSRRSIAKVVSSWLPTAKARSTSGQVRYVADKVALGRVFSEYFGSNANSHSINCSTLINHLINDVR